MPAQYSWRFWKWFAYNAPQPCQCRRLPPMKPQILIAKRATLAAFLTLSLVFAVVGFTPQGKGQKGGSKGNPGKQLPTPDDPTVSKEPNTSKTPNRSKAPNVSKVPTVSKIPGGVYKKTPNGSKVPNNIPTGGGGSRQSCVQSCNTSHKDDAQLCKGRTGQDRGSCQREINERHRVCIQSCPK